MDANGRGGIVCLIAGDTLDVEKILFAVDLRDFALVTLVLAAHDADFVILADGEGTGLSAVNVRL